MPFVLAITFIRNYINAYKMTMSFGLYYLQNSVYTELMKINFFLIKKHGRGFGEIIINASGIIKLFC
jgi:hypothetical protein